MSPIKVIMGFFMSSSKELRSKLTLEVEEVLSSNQELVPFLSAWSVIAERFDGISVMDDSLDPVFQIHNQLMLELQRSGNTLITEEVFISWLLGIKALKKNIVCKATGRVWEPVMESFAAFSRLAGEIVVSDVARAGEKINEFYMWVVQLCNWDGSVKTSSVYH